MVVRLGNNSSTPFIVYEDTPIFVSKRDITKIQGCLDVRTVIVFEKDGYVFEGRVFNGIPNVVFNIVKGVKVAKSII